MEASYFGRPGLLGFTHTPLDVAPSGGVVICSSLHADFFRNYRKEVLLARALSARGLAVQRFQYRGSGNSEGGADEMTFGSLCDDARAAADRLAAQADVTQTTFIGTRFGSLVAAVAGAASGAPLALWEPVLDADRYFKEAFRARMIRELKEGWATAPSSERLMEELRRNGSVDVLGYTIYRALYESASGRRLDAELGDLPRPVLVVQISRGTEVRSDLAAAASSWAQAGFPVEIRVIEQDQAWWFVGEDWQPEEQRQGTSALLKVTGDWVVQAVEGGAPL